MSMTLPQARAIAGSESNPSKMPGYSYGIPASECAVGSVLRKLKGSVCSDCYAMKGRYVFPPVAKAQAHRLALWDAVEAAFHDGDRAPLDQWISAQAKLLGRTPEARIFDSGDCRSELMFMAWCAVAASCPDTTFWMPSKEYGMLKEALTHECWQPPPNLLVRMSGAMKRTAADGPTKGSWLPPAWAELGSVVIAKGAEVPKGVHECPAPQQGGHCTDPDNPKASCRACWDPTVKLVAYHDH